MVKSREDYEADIRKLHADILDDPKSDKLQKQLNRRLSRWVDMLDIAVRVASNEKKPWTEDELKLLTIPMAKKTESEFNQVGDYQFEISTEQGVIQGGLVIERKEVSDLYGTLMSQDRRSRFKREVERYEADPRLDSMTIMVEGSITDFMKYVPKIYICRIDQIPGTGSSKLAEYLKRYYQIYDVNPVNIIKHTDGTISAELPKNMISIVPQSTHRAQLFINGALRDTLIIEDLYGKPALYQMKGASDESKIATIAKLFTKHTPISWCDSRENAIKLYRQMIRLWCIKNYTKLLRNE